MILEIIKKNTYCRREGKTISRMWNKEEQRTDEKRMWRGEEECQEAGINRNDTKDEKQTKQKGDSWWSGLVIEDDRKEEKNLFSVTILIRIAGSSVA